MFARQGMIFTETWQDGTTPNAAIELQTEQLTQVRSALPFIYQSSLAQYLRSTLVFYMNGVGMGYLLLPSVVLCHNIEGQILFNIVGWIYRRNATVAVVSNFALKKSRKMFFFSVKY